MRLLLVAAIWLVACSREPGPPPTRAFYWWRTTFAPTATEQAALAKVDRLYIRLFDVAADGAITAPIDRAPANATPVVFLKNDVFLSPHPGLAARVMAEVEQRIPHPAELQLDCDWTDRTRDAYFAFLRELRGPKLSATIRLHQVKFRERTGVPPVQRGMLMFYNMGPWSADPSRRAIFDETSARQYVARVDDYPLPLDVALPIYSWVAVVRDDKVIDLLQSMDPDERPDFVENGVVTRDAFLHGALLRAGDRLKVEVTTPDDVRAAAGMLAPHLPHAPRTVALFDLSERNLARHGEALASEFAAVR